MARIGKIETQIWPTDLVFAAACAAYRVNNGYLKTPVYTDETTQFPNKVLMRSYIQDPSKITDQDREQADIVRTYWRNKLIAVLSGSANNFIQKAVNLASKESFESTEFFDLATVAYMPLGYVNGIEQDKRSDAIREVRLGSSCIGAVGDKIQGTAKVLDCKWSDRWGVHYVTAQFGNNVILFTYKTKLDNDVEVMFNGTVKAHMDTITRVNRVRIKERT